MTLPVTEVAGRRAYGYCRVSTEDQAREGTSIERQADAIDAYCRSQGWELSAVFFDDVSGTTDERPALQNLLAVLDHGDRVLFTKVDRLYRDTRLALNFVHDLGQRGVELVAVQDHFDTTTAMGRAQLEIVAVFASLEAGMIFERTEAGRRGIVAKKGRRANGRIPFGYRRGREPGSLEPAPGPAAVVQRIFKLRAKRNARPGYWRIATALDREGIATPQGGGRWHARTVQRIVANRVYAGTVSYGVRPQGKRTHHLPATPVEARGTHSPLVSVHAWRLANRNSAAARRLAA